MFKNNTDYKNPLTVLTNCQRAFILYIRLYPFYRLKTAAAYPVQNTEKFSAACYARQQ